MSGWISKCSLVKSDGIPQGTYVHVCAYSMRVQGTDSVWYIYVPDRVKGGGEGGGCVRARIVRM